jgi:hypothetical protein
MPGRQAAGVHARHLARATYLNLREYWRQLSLHELRIEPLPDPRPLCTEPAPPVLTHQQHEAHHRRRAPALIAGLLICSGAKLILLAMKQHGDGPRRRLELCRHLRQRDCAVAAQHVAVDSQHPVAERHLA